ncbi:MAG TPA: efflux RND transporter periplasmic adaptor subunit [Gemmatales bacterium]|nr:efflux RND transporter periplasmic adaptor subunit [Gemmatales bacterium]
MIKLRITYLTFLLSIFYAASFAFGQEPVASKSAVAEVDEHEGHDHAEDHNTPSAEEEGHDDHEGHDHDEEAHEEDHEGHDHDEGEHADHDGHEDHEEGEHDDHDDHDGHEGHDDHDEGGIRLEPEVMQEFGITVEAAAAGVLDLYTVLPGEVQVNRDHLAHIAPRYPGLVIDVKKNIGDQAKKGEVLAVIEGNESLVSYELKSLVNGTIIEKHITLGESLTEDDVVYVVADLNTVWIDLTVYQKDISMIKLGQKVVVSGGEHTAESEGTISYISPTVDEHTRTSLARVVLPNPNGHWRPGMFIEGTVQLSTIEAFVAVPRSAIITIEDRPSVFVMTDDGFVPREVEIGVSDENHAEILKGLQPGELYAAKNILPLKAELNRAGLEHAGHAH